ncbi:guanylyl and adenylyl cyclase family member [Dunaliella salina]|uniref:Guanylyl and adenylyl cyclase family member n=1 Tax=Dunaliella salina TaxID=3046 RepID=A0ABQ7H517_DUNSA|nr:guanylyl and adenylyl cyclase family member [Dunaliella salina]|eukprot:KAF5841951.1 guanylyl and adenylyl cyclase family member [Dunaliella salina]
MRWWTPRSSTGFIVETIGDCYMVAGGLLKREAGGPHTIWSRDNQAGNDDLNPASRIHALAVGMLQAAKSVPMPTTGGHVELRIGMHTGPCVSGIVGRKMPRFCLFGNTVVKAARMETTSETHAIHASWDTWLALGQPWHDLHWRPTNGVQAKGIGLMQTMLWREDYIRRV